MIGGSKTLCNGFCLYLKQNYFVQVIKHNKMNQEYQAKKRGFYWKQGAIMSLILGRCHYLYEVKRIQISFVCVCAKIQNVCLILHPFYNHSLCSQIKAKLELFIFNLNENRMWGYCTCSNCLNQHFDYLCAKLCKNSSV